MIVLEYILTAVFNLFNIYVDFRMLDLFLERRKDRRIFTCTLLGVWFINLIVYVFCGIGFVTLCSILILMFGSTLIVYKGKLVRKIVAVATMMAVGMVLDELLYRVSSYLGFVEKTKVSGILIVSLMMMGTIMLLELFFDEDKGKYITSQSYIHLLIIFAGNCILIGILADIETKNHMAVVVALIALGLIDISTFWLYDEINDAYKEKIEHKMIEDQNSMYKKQFELVRQSEERMDSLQHDLKKHMLLINSYLENAEFDAAKSYVNNIERYMNVPGKYADTGNIELDAILNYSLDKADKLNCETETKITVPKITFMNEFDLNILLGNLLDNALDALCKVRERYLYVGISYNKSMLLIRVKNTYDGVFDENEGGSKSLQKKLKSSKEGKHGIGLKNIKEVVEKYDGEMNVDAGDRYFNVDIILYT